MSLLDDAIKDLRLPGERARIDAKIRMDLSFIETQHRCRLEVLAEEAQDTDEMKLIAMWFLDQADVSASVQDQIYELLRDR